MARRLSDELEDTIRLLDLRMRSLSEQMEIADRILNDLGEDDVYDQFNADLSDVDSYDADSDVDTIAYYTADENRYYIDDDEDDDTETVVGDWDDPYLSPERMFNIVIPDDLEAGLEFLE